MIVRKHQLPQDIRQSETFTDMTLANGRQFLCLALSPWNTTSSLTMPSYRKPPTNNDPSMGGDEQKAEASEGPQRSGISGLFHPVPRCHSFGECHPLQQPKQDVPLNPPLRRPREDLPLNPPLVPGTTTPLMLFQDAFAVLNDFCGNLCTKIPSVHRHMYPYYKRAVCNSEDLLATFETVVRVADYMAVVEKMFDCSRDDMVDVAEALIVALMKLLEKLRHEARDHKINFGHYVTLFDTEKDKHLRVVPKLTRAHVAPDNLQKMSVRLATQLFSRSTAVGIKLYREAKVPGMEDSEGTETFTRMVNDLFDALNIKLPSRGVRRHSKEIQILKDFLEMLNTTERNAVKENLKLFASQQTTESLRVTLLSTIDVIAFLLAQGANYVLTAKLNQDPLEAIPKEKTWRVDLSDMVDFLVDPNSRDHLTVAQQQIRDMRDTIAVTLTSANPPSMTRRQ
ncbi:uncharacterized protein LOC119175690 isoform X2 [Rhipicephalus microplus]|uniref:uncharacterized protein LOC119175690 isoform X2 n=1 Tax=Rhipicephalus microplus TaxID=6941 RepID=UPI003F6ABAD5